MTQAKCKRLKWLRGSSLEDSIMDQISVTSHMDAGRHGSSAEEVKLPHSSSPAVHGCSESVGRESPGGSPSHLATKPHYYVDDSEMPAWKVYAKELFLYGGPGLWRSASLKGSDPVLLMQPPFFDETIDNSPSKLRTGSLSGISNLITAGVHTRVSRSSSELHVVSINLLSYRDSIVYSIIHLQQFDIY